MTPEKLFELINGLIIAVSRLLWPIVVLLAVLLFRKDIRTLLQVIEWDAVDLRNEVSH